MAMVGLQSTRRIGLAFFAACFAALPLQAQESAPAPAETPPEDVLKLRNLSRSGTTWILSDEKSVLKDLRDAKDLYRQVAEGMMGQQQFALGTQNRQAALVQLREQSDLLGQQIAQFDQQLEALNFPGGGNLVQAQRDQINRQRQIVVAENNRVINQLNTLQEMNKDQDQDQKLELNAEVAQSREKYMQAVLDLRKSVNEVTDKYDKLAKNADVTRALVALSASSKTKHKLGPSKALLDAIKVLEKAEGSVQSETIELHREGGVFHVYANLGKVPTKMIFDTGAGLTTISAALASRIGLKSKPGDPTVQLKTADGTVVESKQMVIPLVRVGKFSIANVECAVMPKEKGNVDPLLGQSFFKHFKVEFSPEAGRLSLKRLETEAEPDAKAFAEAEPSKAASKTATKARKPRTQPKAAAKAKSKRATGGRQPAPAGGDQPAPTGAPADSPN
jgi:clan AA aspartic protease (TIGR02281 family)